MISCKMMLSIPVTSLEVVGASKKVQERLLLLQQAMRAVPRRRRERVWAYVWAFLHAKEEDEEGELDAANPALPVQIGEAVWFVLDWGLGQYSISEEPVIAVGKDGFYVPASAPPNREPSDVTFVPYTHIGVDVFFTEEEAKVDRDAKEGAYELDNH